MKWFKVFAIVAFVLALVGVNQAAGQSLIAGDIAGRVTDPAGAVVPNAVINLKSLDTGTTQSAKTSGEGSYRFSLLKPGRYEVSTSVSGFSTISTSVVVEVGQTTQADLKLEIASAASSIEVTTEAPLISTDPGSSTAFSSKEVSLLPSPGGDMTNIAFSAPGAVVNVTGGYGNFTMNGMPATSNLFTVNGENDMDPYFNINNSGASNLTLGSNEVQEATVVTNMYSGQYGTLMGSQVTYVTKSGSNNFHGNAQYWWNGRFMNANDFFTNTSNVAGQPAVGRPFSNANQWAASVGGPILKNKLFFFADTEGLRFVLPNVDTVVSPSPAFQSAVLANVATLQPAELSTYQQLFKLYSAAPGFSNAVPLGNTQGCTNLVLPGWVSGTPCAVSYTATPTSFAKEYIFAARIDFVATSKDNVFFRYKLDHGLQPTYIDPISPNFDANSNQPAYDGQLVWSHVFSSALTNSFTAAGSHYVAQFAQNYALASGTFPFAINYAGSLPFTTGTGGGNFNPLYDFPQGRNITQYQFVDDVSLNKGRNSWKFGINFRRYDVSDHNFFFNSPLVYFRNISGLPDNGNNGVQSFADGVAFQYRQADNLASDVPVALWGMGIYAEDQIKVKSNFTLTLALRAERNSNPVCQNNCFANFTGTFDSIASVTAGAGAGDVPYSSDINYGRHQAFPGVDTLDLSPRIAFSWAPNATDHFPFFPGGGKTVISGGYGLFYDSLAAGLVDNLLANPPASVALRVRTSTGVIPFDPAGAPATFAAGAAAFNINESYNQISSNLSGLGIAFTAPAFNSIVGTVHAPRAQEWNFMVQQQIGRTTALTVNYVGNSVTKLPYNNAWPNGYDCCGLYPTAPQAPQVPNYGTVTQTQSGAISNYNGVNVTVREQLGSQLVGHFNYTFGHNLDEVSNGGIFTYGDSLTSQINPNSLRANNYGNSDYDIRHNISADFVYTPSFKFENKIAAFLIGGWQFSGKLFWRTGLPFTVTDSNLAGALVNSTAPQVAQPIGGTQQRSCGKSDNYTTGNPVYGVNSCLNSFGFVNSGSATFAGYSEFPTQIRNQYRGPNYFDMDMALYKNFRVREGVSLGIGMNAFNVFNHPNFGLPDGGYGDSTFGQITSTVGVPTSPYGNFLGFDSSVRVVQLTAKLVF
ncbi:MAG: carboxypeptidase-like regulatory domain-containing protein [Candidatus Acidiferrum sp.]